jgi:hypothetical protein
MQVAGRIFTMAGRRRARAVGEHICRAFPRRSP